MMVTLKQIAAACNVSVATVSKSLNHAPDISAETADKVQKVARELGYCPNAVARALKTNRSHNIGVLFDDDTHCGLTHEYFSQILNAVKNAAEARGYDVTFISKNIGQQRMSYLEHCQYRNVDGAVIANVDFAEQSVAELVSSDLPVVTIDYMFDSRSAVISDNVQGMRDLVSHIHSLGHRRIAFVCGELTAVTRSRLASFYKTCRELGLEVPNEYVINARYHDPRQSGLATRELLKLPSLPSCIIYPDDISALGGITELEKAGLSIPADISVAGYDGITLSRLLRPTLTTLRQDSETLGEQAADLLIQAIEDSKVYVPQLLIVPGEVQPGETVRDIRSTDN